MRVSVAIATFNRASMVGQAIAAALGQSHPPDEIVVADDASTDSSWQVLEELARSTPSLRLFRRERNSGGAENWSFAIGQARGDYIAWCSDDDRFAPGHLAASVQYLEAHPEVGLVHSGFIDIIETAAGMQAIPRPLRFPQPQIVTQRSLFGYLTRYYDWPFHPSTLVFRRAVWECTGPFNPAYALADTDWFVRAVERYPGAMLARHGVYNRRHAGNWSNRLGSARMQREIFNIVESAIARRWPTATLQRCLWRAAWRSNVRLRLLLTLLARLKSRHADAACAVWSMFASGTGRTLPGWVERGGRTVIRSLCGGRTPRFESIGESVSPQ